jgi:hypothetical protein
MNIRRWAFGCAAIAFALALSANPRQVAAQPAKPPPPVLPPQGQPQGPLPTLNIVVSDRDRNTILEFYRAEIAAGHCPTPMVRSNKACVVPDKKPWKLDQAIPDDVKLEAPPGSLILKLSPSPAGYHYQCLGPDVLLVGVGTRIVTAWAADLTRL